MSLGVGEAVQGTVAGDTWFFCPIAHDTDCRKHWNAPKQRYSFAGKLARELHECSQALSVAGMSTWVVVCIYALGLRH
jgi:hypothetical protein